jgi:hypothetical protein
MVIRKSQPIDLENSAILFDGLMNQEQVIADLKTAILDGNKSDLVAFSVYIQDTIIGMYCLSKHVNLPYLSSHFCI